MKPWRKQFGIWVPERSLSDERGYINAGAVGAIAGSRRRSGGSYDPSSDSAVVFWYKADGTLYTTDSGTTPCTNGDAVGKWIEAKAGGSGKDAIQATSGDRPVFTTGGPNSKPYVNFSANNRKLAVSWASNLSQPFTVWAVVKVNSTSTLGYIFDGYSSSNRVITYNYITGYWRLYAGSEADNLASSTSWVLVKSIYNGASSKIALNNGADTTTNPGTGSLAGISIGARYAASGVSQISIAELIFQNQASANESDVKAYLNGKYALY